MRSGDKRPAPRTSAPIERAFDELRFGAARTLNLRDGLPTALQAETRVDAWLRRQQAEGGGEVLIITGRGVGSLDGVGKVRDAVQRKCVALRRLNVVRDIAEHGPGAFVVVVEPLRALVDAPRLRTGKTTPTPIADPGELAALPDDVRALLREVAHLTVTRLGVREPSDEMIASEMRTQFGALAPGIVGEKDQIDALRRLLRRLRDELREL
jgi:hypothetical protein